MGSEFGGACLNSFRGDRFVLVEVFVEHFGNLVKCFLELFLVLP